MIKTWFRNRILVVPQEERVIRGTSHYRRQKCKCMVPQARALVIEKLANHTLVQPGRVQEKQVVLNTKTTPRCNKEVFKSSRKTKRIEFVRKMKTLAVVAATTVVVSSRQLLTGTGSRRVVTVEPLIIKEISSQTSSSSSA